MRMQIFIICLSMFATQGIANELQSNADAERQSNIDAARAESLELHRVVASLDNFISEAEARSVPAGKRSGERSGGKIVNGVSTGSYPTAGALINGLSAGSAKSHCTGTLIGPRTFLTAAHCVNSDPDPDMYHVFLQHGGIYSVETVAIHPDYQFPHADLAVIRLSEEVEGIRPSPLNDLQLPMGTRGDIVGYGRAGGFNFDYGIKRVGSVQMSTCEPHRPPSLLCWNFDDPVGVSGLDSNTCNADSGGPLYIQRVADGPLILAGVTSGGSQSDCLAGDHSYDVDVAQFNLWIKNMANGDVDTAGSGGLAEWGTDKVNTLRAEVDFTTALRSRIYTLDVPANIQRLRIAMNGHDKDGRNFDLYVKSGDTASSADNDCAQNGTGQYAFCEFAQPDTGTWSILLEATNGNGIAQVSATLFEN